MHPNLIRPRIIHRHRPRRFLAADTFPEGKKADEGDDVFRPVLSFLIREVWDACSRVGSVGGEYFGGGQTGV